ncbi:MAG: hypothetical protein JWL77_758, partial [Chthonomonadaceae bacterium]|nr:hypothetical protein [Chthonomonadaceae bacterium]
MIHKEEVGKPASKRKPPSALRRWFFQGQVEEGSGPFEQELRHKTHPWWQVMCLTGVDYFSTLGYQPGIAALAAGALSPIATLILVLLTLFGALPIYRYVAEESPHGEGSIAMMERHLGSWLGKLFVLCLLGFVATDFVITITLSAADATAHVIENPFTHRLAEGHSVGITLFMVALLGAIFLKGFKEAIGIAVALVGVYLVMNTIVVADGLYHVLSHPAVFGHWKGALFAAHGNPLLMIGVSLLLFPKLALGLSGFETGVALMPLVEGAPGDKYEKPTGRIVNTRKLLVTAATIMSVFLLTSSLVTTLLIPPHEFAEPGYGHPAGRANGRALAYLAHRFLGNGFGTAYDISTILILWFAGASAMAGLLNIVPRYLPRYGMAPDWTRATRPLALVFTSIAFAVTVHFKADVNAQGGAYATGVLVLMTSAAVAVTTSVWRKKRRGPALGFGLITAVFVYTTIVNIIERPDGIKIASFFIATIIVTSLLSRVWRATELRVGTIAFDATAQRFIDGVADHELHIIANKRQAGDEVEYREKEKAQRQHNRIPPECPVLFLEVEIKNASD